MQDQRLNGLALLYTRRAIPCPQQCLNRFAVDRGIRTVEPFEWQISGRSLAASEV